MSDTALATSTCRWCPAALHRVADEKAGEWIWVDEAGHQLGDDPDVAHLQPDPYAYLAALGERILAAPKGKPDYAAGREYSALKVRLETGGTWHVHQPGSPGPVYAGPVPWCCGWPGWLRPSGWQCRRRGPTLVLGSAA